MRQPGGRRATHRRLTLAGQLRRVPAQAARSRRRDGIQALPQEAPARARGRGWSCAPYREPDDLDRIFADTEPVAAQTYQRGLGVALQDSRSSGRCSRSACGAAGSARTSPDLYGRPVAFWPGSAYRGVFYIGTPGYDPAVGRIPIGNYLLMRMIEDFCADPVIATVDYGFGDGEYKRRFSTEELGRAGRARPCPGRAASARSAPRARRSAPRGGRRGGARAGRCPGRGQATLARAARRADLLTSAGTSSAQPASSAPSLRAILTW